eukprot:g22989.t1
MSAGSLKARQLSSDRNAAALKEKLFEADSGFDREGLRAWHDAAELTFMLSQDLPRAAPPPPGAAQCRSCASMLLVIPPVGYAGSLEPTERSGEGLWDQEYEVWLRVRNPLFNPDGAENKWRFMTRWAESASSYVTLHEADLPGFSLTGMEARYPRQSLLIWMMHTAGQSGP